MQTSDMHLPKGWRLHAHLGSIGKRDGRYLDFGREPYVMVSRADASRGHPSSLAMPFHINDSMSAMSGFYFICSSIAIAIRLLLLHRGIHRHCIVLSNNTPTNPSSSTTISVIPVNPICHSAVGYQHLTKYTRTLDLRHQLTSMTWLMIEADVTWF